MPHASINRNIQAYGVAVCSGGVESDELPQPKAWLQSAAMPPMRTEMTGTPNLASISPAAFKNVTSPTHDVRVNTQSHPLDANSGERDGSTARQYPRSNHDGL